MTRLEESNYGGAKWPPEGYVLMAQSARLNPATILIVENEALIRLELTDWLTEQGLTVLAADDADEAIALLDSHPEIELLMTDIQMPGSMDGIRLAHHVRDRWPPVKIIVASAKWGTQLCDLPAGSVFVPKPLEPQDLWRTIAHVMEERPPPAQNRRAS